MMLPTKFREGAYSWRLKVEDQPRCEAFFSPERCVDE